MKIFDEKGRLFGLINIVDLCIIVFVIAAASGAYAFLKNNITKSSPTQTYNVTLEFKGIEKDFGEAIIPGKTVYDRVQSQPFGVLNDVRLKPTVEYNVSNDDGEIKRVTVPDRYTAELDMQLTTDTEIYVGKYLSIATKDFTGAGYVIKMEKVEE